MKQRLAVILALSLMALGCGSTQTQAPQGVQSAQPLQPSTEAPHVAQPSSSSAVATVAPSSSPPSPQPTPSPAAYLASPAADPVAAVNAALDALVAKHWAVLPGLICAEKRASIAGRYDPAAQTMFPHKPTQALIDALVIRIADRSVSSTSSTAETAMVKVGGTLTQKVSDQALQDFGSALAAAATVTPTKDMLDGISKTLKTSMDSIVLSPEVQVVAEDGGWLLCSDPLMTRPAEPAQGAATPKPTEAGTSAVVPIPAADPVAAVNAVLDALVAKQWDKLPALMCPDMRASIPDLSGTPQGKQLTDALTIDFTNRDVTMKGTLVSGVPWRATVDGALVNIAGHLSMTVPDAAIRSLLEQVEAEGSPSPDPSAMDQMMTQTTEFLHSLAIAPVATVTNDGGGWLVCSPVLVFARPAEPSPSPTS